MDIIDSHLHLINLDEGGYHWMSNVDWQDKAHLCRSFSEEELCLDKPLSLAGFVHVEAGFDNERPWREIEWLEKHCTLPFKSIAFADLTGDFLSTLERLLQYSSVVGVRNIFEENAADVLSSKQTYEYLAELSRHDKLFEVGFNITDTVVINALCALMQELPDLKVVIDHAGLYAEDPAWQGSMTKLAEQKNSYVKCSGWEMEAHNQTMMPFTTITLRIKQLLELFGEDRLLLGSNFPLCLLKQSYQAFWTHNKRFLTDKVLTESEWNKLSYTNAQRLFGF